MPIIQSVERALAILDLFDEYHVELPITEISKRMGLHKSTVHSLLKTLQEHRYIDQSAKNGKYRLGMKLLERSGQLMQSLDIGRVAQVVLADIAEQTGQTTNLVILDGNEGVYIQKVEGAKSVIRYSRIGKRIPLHCSAVGKVLAAFLSEEQLTNLIRGYDYRPMTDHTILSEAEFLQELGNVRSRGYAVDDEENEPGVRCLAVPVRDHTGEVKAAMSISMLIARVAPEDYAAYETLMLKKGQELSVQMGYGAIRGTRM